MKKLLFPAMILRELRRFMTVSVLVILVFLELALLSSLILGMKWWRIRWRRRAMYFRYL